MRLPIVRILASLLVGITPACVPAQPGQSGTVLGADAECPSRPIALADEHPAVYFPCQVDQPWVVDSFGRMPRHPEILKAGGIGGFARLPVVIDTSGHARPVALPHASHDLFVVAVRNALPHWRFRPATRGARKVAVLDTVEVRFATPERLEIEPGCTDCNPTEYALRVRVEQAAERHARCDRALSAFVRRPPLADSLAWWSVDQLPGCERASDAAALAIRVAAGSYYKDPAAATPAFAAGERVGGQAVLDAAEEVAGREGSVAARLEAFALLSRVITGYARHAGLQATWDAKRKRPTHGCGSLRVGVEMVPLPPEFSRAVLRHRVEQTARAIAEAAATPAAVRVAAFCASAVLRESAGEPPSPN